VSRTPTRRCTAEKIPLSEDRMTEEYRKKIDDLISAIKVDKEQLADLEAIALENSPVKESLERLENQMRELEKERQGLLAAHMDAVKDVLSDIASCKKGIERKTESLKNLFHNMPRGLIENGLRYSFDDVTVSVSRTKFVTTYKTAQLLADYPELEGVYVDGDPLCSVTIVPEVLERLIATDKVEIGDIEKYRIVTPQRSPSVSISFPEEKK